MHTESSYNVILLYLIDIDFCYKVFIKNLARCTTEPISTELSKIYIQKNQSQNNNIESLKSLKGSVSNNVNKKFRLRLIYNYIFAPFKGNSITCANDMYETLICIENKIIHFLQDYFSSFPYTYLHSKNLLDKIIEEKKQNIETFQSQKSA